MTCSPLFPRIESAVPTFKDIGAAVVRASWQRARATWIPDQWLDCESVETNLCILMYSEVRTRFEVGGLNCSGYTFLSTDRYDTNAMQLKKTSAFCRCIARGQICHWHSTVKWFQCAPNPRFQAILESVLPCARNEKAARGSDLNRTTTSPANHRPGNFWNSLFFLQWKQIVKSGTISGWTYEDQLQIWHTHSSSTNDHLHYLLQ